MPVKLISTELLLLTFFGVLRSFFTPLNEASPMPLPTDFLPLPDVLGDLLELDFFEDLGVATLLGVLGDVDLALGESLVSLAAVLAGDTLGEADLALGVPFVSDFGVADLAADVGVAGLGEAETAGVVFGDSDLDLRDDFGVFGDLDLPLGVVLETEAAFFGDSDLDRLEDFGVDSVVDSVSGDSVNASGINDCCLGLDFLVEPDFGDTDLALGVDFLALPLLVGVSDLDLGAFFWDDFGDFLFCADFGVLGVCLGDFFFDF